MSCWVSRNDAHVPQFASPRYQGEIEVTVGFRHCAMAFHSVEDLCPPRPLPEERHPRSPDLPITNGRSRISPHHSLVEAQERKPRLRDPHGMFSSSLLGGNGGPCGAFHLPGKSTQFQEKRGPTPHYLTPVHPAFLLYHRLATHCKPRRAPSQMWMAGKGDATSTFLLTPS